MSGNKRKLRRNSPYQKASTISANRRRIDRKTHIEKKKKVFRTRIYLFAASFVTVAALLAVFIWCISFETLDMEKYMDITYDGYDGKCTVTPHITAIGNQSAFLGTVKCKLETEQGVENGQLKNGDQITVICEYDKKLSNRDKIKVKNAVLKKEISGLDKGKDISTEELFSKVSLTYEGIAPELKITVQNENTDPFLKDIKFAIVEPKDFYDVGEQFTVKADISSEAAIQNGYAIEGIKEGCTKEYTIEKQDRYLRESSLITKQQLDEMNQTAVSLFGDAKEYGLRIFSEANLMPIWVNNKTTFVWSNPRLISAYFNVLKPEAFDNKEVHNNDVKLVYMVNLSQANGVSCEAEVVVRFIDLIEKEDGTLDLALDSGKIIAASYKNKHIKALVNDAYNECYESTQISINE